MAQVNRGIILIFKDKSSTRDIESLVDDMMESGLVESVGFFPNDVDRLMERHGRLTNSDGFLQKFMKRIKEKIDE